MNHSEAAFSIEQLLGFKVCLDFTDVTQPPLVSFESVRPPQPWQSPALCGSSPLIKFETTHLAIDGRCILKVYAIDSTSPEASALASETSLCASANAYNTDLDAQYNSRSSCSSHDALQHHLQGQAHGYTITPKMEDPNYLPISPPQSWLNLPNPLVQGYDAASGRSHTIQSTYHTGGFSLQHRHPSGDDSFMDDINMPNMSGSISISSSYPSSQSYAGHFTAMPDPRAGDFFRAFEDADTQPGLGSQSEALGFAIGDPCSRQQPEVDLSRVVYASEGSSPYHKALAGFPPALPVQSEDVDSSTGSVTPATSFYSLSERSTPEPESLNRSDARLSPTPDAPSKNATGAAAPRRRGKARNKPSYLYIYHCPHPTCTRVFRSEYTCRVHSGVHIPKPRKVIPCTQSGCLETFTRQHDRLRHEVAQHGKICEFSCSSCHRFFSSAVMLEKHKCSSYRR
ncbi:hypothetical protein NEOLEDRAFT_1141174 [Neolentinus lepideus HHB14362 ss-1]|uniref:C2H2-type domain-containing protein n=1 Tax=Neolentinus lepideus HHB14362 ss-1 TaxID=1314782 RepID=A0A165NTK5_9AGAM|nr:hypothetical protein NEOLEDRAFT_1141174 [Neolentinus lepideus HHB14362 ss-1]